MTKISYDLDYKENLSKRQWTNMKLIVFFGHNVIKLEKKKQKDGSFSQLILITVI